jgi:hypothetical protein
MVESRWFRRAGPGVAAIGAVALVASSTLGAPNRAWDPPVCADTPHAGSGTAVIWYRLDPTLRDGALTGQRLSLGGVDGAAIRFVDLDPESFAVGPFDGTVLVGTDHSGLSRLSLVDLAAGCAWPLGASTDVVRGATVSPDRTTIYEHRVDRSTRADLGVWRRPLDGSNAATRVLAPMTTDERFGATWRTSLSWSADARLLAVSSCGEVACRFRLFDPADATLRTVADPALGDLLGVGDGRLVAYGACRGLPCPLFSVDVDGSGERATLADQAGAAVLTTDADGRPVVVHERGVDGKSLREMRTDGGDPRDLDGLADGRRLVAGPSRTDSAADLPPGWLLFGPDGRLPIDGQLGPILRHIPDGTAVPLDEVAR